MNSGSEKPSEPKVHIYLPGESLVEIANEHGVALQELLQANILTQHSILFPGQKLFIPVTERVAEQKPTAIEHVVGLGETISTIADKYGLKVDDLRKFNQLEPTAMLYPGTYLSLVAKPELPQFTSSKAPKHCLIHGYHKVKPGDQLSRIAAFHGITTQSLLTANNLGWNSIVAPGSKLIIPISHNALNCPNLVELSATSLSIAESLVNQGKQYGLGEYACVIALCLEMQRSGLQPELGNKTIRVELLKALSSAGLEDKTVQQTLEEIGYRDLAEGAALWEPSAWAWLHQVGSNSE